MCWHSSGVYVVFQTLTHYNNMVIGLVEAIGEMKVSLSKINSTMADADYKQLHSDVEEENNVIEQVMEGVVSSSIQFFNTGLWWRGRSGGVVEEGS